MELILKLMKKYKSLIFYGVFWAMTTIVNLIVYNLCYYRLGINNTISNILVWFVAVTFAFLTNKSLVFESKF